MPGGPKPPQPNEFQRRLIGELVLLGNQRVELYRELGRVEVATRMALVRAYLGAAKNKRMLARAAQIDVRTVYSWLMIEGVDKRPRKWAASAKIAKHPVLGLSDADLVALEAELVAAREASP